MDLQTNLENILNLVNIFINIDSQRQKYTLHFNNTTNTIFKLLRNFRVFAYMFNGYQLGGSYRDNVKVTTPNEFDLVFHIKFPEQSLIIVEKDPDLPGNVFLNFTKVLRKIEKEKQHEQNLHHLKQWLDDKNYLRVEKFQSFLQGCFTSVLTKLQKQIHFNEKTAFLDYKRCGPAHTINVFESEAFKYSVDFVPGILLNGVQCVISKTFDQWEAIPKPTPVSNQNFKSFRASFYRQEQKIIQNKHQLKNAYRMMKKFRDSKTNMLKMKSYYIKTLFLWKASTEENTYWTKSLTEIIIDMFKDMAKSLQKENLPYFWDKKLNLYEFYSSRLMREMLICVESSKETLEKAVKNLALPLQNRVFCIFLTEVERKLLHTQYSGAKGETFKQQKEHCPAIPNNPNKLKIKPETDQFKDSIKQFKNESQDDVTETIDSKQRKKENQSTCILA